MKKIIYYTGLIFIAIFLFATHSKFLFILEPEKDIALFSFFGIDFKEVIPYIFGAAFGIVTAILIRLIQKDDKLFWYFAISVAVFEMIGIFLYNNTEIVKHTWKWFASIYYALYSGFIVFMYSYISHSDKKEESENMQKTLSKIGVESCKAGETLREMYIDNVVTTNKLANNSHLNIFRIEKKSAQKNEKQLRNKKIMQMSSTMSPQEIAKEIGINQSTVYRILKNKENANKNENNN